MQISPPWQSLASSTSRRLVQGQVASPAGNPMPSTVGQSVVGMPQPQFTPYSMAIPQSPPSFRPSAGPSQGLPKPNFGQSIPGQGYNPLINVAGYGIDTSIPGFNANLDQLTSLNPSYRVVLHTGEWRQVVLMNLEGNEATGPESHPGTEQFIEIKAGQGYAIIAGRRVELKPGVVLNIPGGVEHNIVSTGQLKLYSIYSPPRYPYDAVDQSREEARQVGR